MGTGRFTVGGVTLCDGLASHPGENRNTPSHFMLQKPAEDKLWRYGLLGTTQTFLASRSLTPEAVKHLVNEVVLYRALAIAYDQPKCIKLKVLLFIHGQETPRMLEAWGHLSSGQPCQSALRPTEVAHSAGQEPAVDSSRMVL